MNILIHTLFFSPINSKDLIVNPPLQLLHISLLISYKNLVLDPDINFYLISFSILVHV